MCRSPPRRYLPCGRGAPAGQRVFTRPVPLPRQWDVTCLGTRCLTEGRIKYPCLQAFSQRP